MKEPMQRIVEAAGEKWHTLKPNGLKCSCGTSSQKPNGAKMHVYHANPSRTDLNELFRLAKKATPWEVKLTQSGEKYICYFFSTPFTCEVEVKADTPADALLNALDQAIGGSDE